MYKFVDLGSCREAAARKENATGWKWLQSNDSSQDSKGQTPGIMPIGTES